MVVLGIFRGEGVLEGGSEDLRGEGGGKASERGLEGRVGHLSECRGVLKEV